MRILYTIMAYGPQIIASEVHSELGREFRAAGNSFAVLSLDDYGTKGEAGAALFEGEVGVVPLYTIRFQNDALRRFGRKLAGRLFQYAFFIELVLGLAGFLRKHRQDFDIIHVEAAYPLGAAWAIAAWLTRSKIPFILNLQGADVMSLPRYDYGYARFRLPRLLLRFAFRRCAGVRANSEQTAELAKGFGADPSRVRVIYRNISDNIYPDPSVDLKANKTRQQQMLRERYGLKPGPVIIALSRLHPFKGLDILVEALPALRERWLDINLLICGPSRRTAQFGDYREYLEKLARKAGVLESIVFTGKVEFAESAAYQAGADLLVVPSIVEALNKVVIEAAAVGTPAVITETTGISYPAVKGGVGLSVKASSPEALAEGIAELLENEQRRTAMSEQGSAWAKGFSSASIAKQLLDFYRFVGQVGQRLCYVAYPSSLVLKSANAIQTFTTCRELKELDPSTLILLPRLPGRPSRFSEIGARHLLRIPFNFFNNFRPLKVIPWSYFERTFFCFEVGLLLLWYRLTGRGVKTVYVRDVICAYWLIRWWRSLLGVRVIYEAHDLEARNPSRAKSPRLRRWLEKVDRTVIGESDTLVSLTGIFLDYVIEQGLRAKNNRPVAVIPDAFDAQTYYPLSETARAEARQQLGVAPEEFVIVYSGLTFAYRSLDKLLEAFSRFLSKHPGLPARLIFAGGRPFERKEIEELAQKLGLARRVQCVGQQGPEKVNLYLNASSLLAIPDTVTDLTASPLKLFEYAAVERPIMLPDLPALREILPGQEAFYFERGSIEGMQAAIEKVYTHPAEAEQAASAARQCVAQYTYANRARTILDLLSQ
ncbi:MAG TPA: glycosyltransferase [Chloroflexia bacterium]|nr:glycosyltransferase [Chloroflexia bacterium]